MNQGEGLAEKNSFWSTLVPCPLSWQMLFANSWQTRAALINLETMTKKMFV